MKILLVDGLNVVRYQRDSMEFKTEKEKSRSNLLLNKINELNKDGSVKVEIFFDGNYRKLINEGYSMDLLFSKTKTADALIINAVADYKGYGPTRQVFVVSSDKRLCEICQEYGAKTISTPEFLNRINFIEFAYNA